MTLTRWRQISAAWRVSLSRREKHYRETDWLWPEKWRTLKRAVQSLKGSLGWAPNTAMTDQYSICLRWQPATVALRFASATLCVLMSIICKIFEWDWSPAQKWQEGEYKSTCPVVSHRTLYIIFFVAQIMHHCNCLCLHVHIPLWAWTSLWHLSLGLSNYKTERIPLLKK